MLKSFFILLFFLLCFFAVEISYPLSMAFLLMGACLTLSCLMLKYYYSWLLFLLVLMFLGGIMIMVIYMASLVANEKMKPSYKFGSTYLIFVFAFYAYLDTQVSAKPSSSYAFVGSFFDPATANLTVFCFLVLLLALISVVKLMKLEAGPMVKRLLNPNLMKMCACQVQNTLRVGLAFYSGLFWKQTKGGPLKAYSMMFNYDI